MGTETPTGSEEGKKTLKFEEKKDPGERGALPDFFKVLEQSSGVEKNEKKQADVDLLNKMLSMEGNPMVRAKQIIQGVRELQEELKHTNAAGRAARRAEQAGEREVLEAQARATQLELVPGNLTEGQWKEFDDLDSGLRQAIEYLSQESL